MNGAHDLGGMHGFDPVDIASGTQLFHEPWERRVFALTLACGFLGEWNIDQSRYARERMAPAEYLNTSYYEHWLHGLQVLLLERGLLCAEELDSGSAQARVDRAIDAAAVASILSRGGPADCAAQTAAKLAPGDCVRVANDHPVGHTRAPRFVRGCVGEVVRHHGSHVWPDRSSQADGVKLGAHLYNVKFTSEALWGAGAEAGSVIYADLFEPYLERVV